VESPAIRTLYDDLTSFITGLAFGGIYAKKPGYHNKRSANPAGNYSVLLSVDRQGPDMASALDLTMRPSWMATITDRLRRAALDPEDDRTSYIREFIGTLDGNSVYCLIANGPGTRFVSDSGRDESHLWHVHISFYRLYCNDPQAMKAIYSVLSGQSYRDWIEAEMELTGTQAVQLRDVHFTTAKGINDPDDPTGTTQVPLHVWCEKTSRAIKALQEAATPPAIDYDRLAKAIVTEALARTTPPV
jgi:hypothetical protein